MLHHSAVALIFASSRVKGTPQHTKKQKNTHLQKNNIIYNGYAPEGTPSARKNIRTFLGIPGKTVTRKGPYMFGQSGTWCTTRGVPNLAEEKQKKRCLPPLIPFGQEM